jgi:hypothetical protein
MSQCVHLRSYPLNDYHNDAFSGRADVEGARINTQKTSPTCAENARGVTKWVPLKVERKL